MLRSAWRSSSSPWCLGSSQARLSCSTQALLRVTHATNDHSWIQASKFRTEKQLHVTS